MKFRTSLMLVLLAGITPNLASAGTLINEAFDATDITFDVGGVETIMEGEFFSTTPAEGCPVNYAVPTTGNSTSVDVLSPNHFFGPSVNFFGGATASSALETQLNTVAGQTYSVFFNLNQVGTFSTHKIIASAAGASSGQVGPGNHGFTFVASGANTTLTFTGLICSNGSNCNAGSDISLNGLTITTDSVIAACGGDEDADSVADVDDQCPGSKTGALVDATGCSINQYCGCDDFRNHGGYVSCTARTAEAFLQDQLIVASEKRSIIRTAARSSCGKPEKKHSNKHSNKHSEKHSEKHSKKNKSKKKHSHKGKH